MSDPSFDASAHRIVNFADIYAPTIKIVEKKLTDTITMIEEEPIDSPTFVEVTNLLITEFKTRGWAIIRFPKDIPSTAPIFRKKVDSKLVGTAQDAEPFYAFFSQAQEAKEKCLGYSEVPHKESIHIETPNQSLEEHMPESIRTQIKNWYQLYDAVAIDLIEILCQPIYGCDKATLAHRADLPIAYGDHVGMIDVAYYKNQQVATISPAVGHSTEDVNCVPHYDPGFLSISFLSTHDGLQLQDPSTGTWYAGPVNTICGQEDLGVIWLGDAAVKASKGTLGPGVHRVVYPQTAKPRISVWYEMCTVDQLNQNRLASMATGEVQLPNLPGSKPLKMNGDIRLLERHYGLSLSKTMRREDHFRAAYSADVDNSRRFGFNFKNKN